MTKVFAPFTSYARRAGDHGSVATETALIAVPFLLVLISIFEIAIMMMAANAVQAAAGEVAIRGRDLEDPAAIEASWAADNHAFPFADQITLDFECFASAKAMAAQQPEAPCAGARLIAWTASTNWHAITPMINWAFPDGITLSARGVSYR